MPGASPSPSRFHTIATIKVLIMVLAETLYDLLGEEDPAGCRVDLVIFQEWAGSTIGVFSCP